MLDEIPEEDRLLHEQMDKDRAVELAKQAIRNNEARSPAVVPVTQEHKHEWVDMYAGGGYKRGNQTIGLQAFYCKWCLEIQVKEFNQSQYNLRSIEDEGDFRDDG